MADPLDNANEILEELKGAALHTSQGSFVRVEHVERLLKQRRDAREEALDQRLEDPPPKTWEGARRRAARDLREQYPRTGPPDPGEAVPAQY